MLSKRDPDPRLLIGALVLSSLLHALLLFAGRIDFAGWDPARRTVIQASLRLPPNAAFAPPTTEQARESAKPAPGQRSSPATGTAGAKAPGEEKAPQAERREHAALVLSDAGAPEYPDEAVRRGLESCVLAAVLVSAGGEVQSVRILHADVAAVFDGAVIDAYSRARYLPAQSNGENVPSRVLAVASFVLAPQRPRHCAGRYAAAARRINALPLSAQIDPALVESTLHGAR